MCDTAPSRVWHNSDMQYESIICVSFICVSFICVTWCIRLYMWHDVFVWLTYSYVPLLHMSHPFIYHSHSYFTQIRTERDRGYQWHIEPRIHNLYSFSCHTHSSCHTHTHRVRSRMWMACWMTHSYVTLLRMSHSFICQTHSIWLSLTRYTHTHRARSRAWTACRLTVASVCASKSRRPALDSPIRVQVRLFGGNLCILAHFLVGLLWNIGLL